MMKSVTGISVRRVKSFGVRQKGNDAAVARSIVDTQGIRDIAEGV